MSLSLTPSQKLLCERIVNVFETGSASGDYSCISIFHDGPHEVRQITYGRSQTTEYGNLQELVQMYVAAGGKYAESLRPYVAKIGKNPLVDDATFKSLLVHAAKEDPVMGETQDAFFDKRYFAPALKWAEDHGFTQALSALVSYDSFVHSGGILAFLRESFSEKVPADGGDEKIWISEYVRARAHWLATSERTILHATTYRTDCFTSEIKRGNWDLAQLPIIAHGTRVDAGSPVGVSHPLVPSSTPVPTPAPKMEPPMADSPAAVTPASAFGILLSPILNILTHVFNSAGSVLIGAGGSTLLATLLNVQTGPFASIAAGSTIVGAIMTGAAYYASHTLVKGTNSATVSAATPPTNS